MKILIVHAHENPHSFCSALANLTKSTLEAKGHQVTISNLYQKTLILLVGKMTSPHYLKRIIINMLLNN